MAQTTTLFDSLTLYPIDETPDSALATAVGQPDDLGRGLPPLEDTLIIGFGGSGKQTAAYLYALGVWAGVRPRVRVFDNDHRAPDPVALPDGRSVSLPADALVWIDAPDARTVMSDAPLLVNRYEGSAAAPGLLRGIPVFETYGRGGGGYPVYSALCFDLAMREVREALRRALLSFARPDGEQDDDFYLTPANPASIAPPRPCTMLFIGGGCGSPGPAGHRLLPYIARQEALNLGLPDPYRVGVVLGPTLYGGFHSRAVTNWLATVQEIDDLSRHGMRGWDCIDGTTLDAAVPPYARVVLVDGERTGEQATEVELHRFCASVAKALYTALASDVFSRIESMAMNDGGTPWTTLRGVLAQVDMPAVQGLAAACRVRDRLRTLIPGEAA